MELSNYELVRYPSGQLVLLRTAYARASRSGPRDVVGVFTSEAEAQSALARLAVAHIAAGHTAAHRPAPGAVETAQARLAGFRRIWLPVERERWPQANRSA